MLFTALTLAAARSIIPETPEWSLQVVIELGFLAGGLSIGFLLWEYGMRYGDFALLSTASYTLPLMSMIFACLYLQVLPGFAFWMGALLLVTGAFISNRSIADQHAQSASSGSQKMLAKTV